MNNSYEHSVYTWLYFLFSLWYNVYNNLLWHTNDIHRLYTWLILFLVHDVTVQNFLDVLCVYRSRGFYYKRLERTVSRHKYICDVATNCVAEVLMYLILQASNVSGSLGWHHDDITPSLRTQHYKLCYNILGTCHPETMLPVISGQS